MQHTILVIDDQWSMQELARIVLRTAGYRVLLASDAVTGLCLARIEHPDVTVMDMKLTDRDSNDVLEDLRHDPATANIPVILVSTEMAHGQTTHCGATGYLHKPFHSPELLRMVDQMIHRDKLSIAI
jgi:DNA-binding response OmpR family regulator